MVCYDDWFPMDRKNHQVKSITWILLEMRSFLKEK